MEDKIIIVINQKLAKLKKKLQHAWWKIFITELTHLTL